MEYIIIISVLVFCCWVYYLIQKRVGEHQKMDWEDFKKENPHLFKTNKETLNTRHDNAQKKSM